MNIGVCVSFWIILLFGYIPNSGIIGSYAEYIMRNTGLEEAQAGIKIAGEISITSDMQMTPSSWQKVKKN